MFRFYDSTQRKPTSDRRLNPGPAITIGDDLIPASDRAHQIRVRRRPSFKSNDIAFQKAATLCRFQFWVVYITNTGLRRLGMILRYSLTSSDRLIADDRSNLGYFRCQDVGMAIGPILGRSSVFQRAYRQAASSYSMRKF